ncbi:MAG TPA: hypothetical protein VM030_01325 [Acidimicrobiales bacterium]|nr:hypothetical protein [Acidimicrobiales bacterium]
MPLEGRYSRLDASPTSMGFIGRSMVTIPIVVVWLFFFAVLLSAPGPTKAMALFLLGLVSLGAVGLLSWAWARTWTDFR